MSSTVLGTSGLISQSTDKMTAIERTLNFIDGFNKNLSKIEKLLKLSSHELNFI